MLDIAVRVWESPPTGRAGHLRSERTVFNLCRHIASVVVIACDGVPAPVNHNLDQPTVKTIQFHPMYNLSTLKRREEQSRKEQRREE